MTSSPAATIPPPEFDPQSTAVTLVRLAECDCALRFSDVASGKTLAEVRFREPSLPGPETLKRLREAGPRIDLHSPDEAWHLAREICLALRVRGGQEPSAGMRLEHVAVPGLPAALKTLYRMLVAPPTAASPAASAITPAAPMALVRGALCEALSAREGAGRAIAAERALVFCMEEVLDPGNGDALLLRQALVSWARHKVSRQAIRESLKSLRATTSETCEAAQAVARVVLAKFWADTEALASPAMACLDRAYCARAAQEPMGTQAQFGPSPAAHVAQLVARFLGPEASATSVAHAATDAPRTAPVESPTEGTVAVAVAGTVEEMLCRALRNAPKVGAGEFGKKALKALIFCLEATLDPSNLDSLPLRRALAAWARDEGPQLAILDAVSTREVPKVPQVREAAEAVADVVLSANWERGAQRVLTALGALHHAWFARQGLVEAGVEARARACCEKEAEFAKIVAGCLRPETSTPPPTLVAQSLRVDDVVRSAFLAGGEQALAMGWVLAERVFRERRALPERQTGTPLANALYEWQLTPLPAKLEDARASWHLPYQNTGRSTDTALRAVGGALFETTDKGRASAAVEACQNLVTAALERSGALSREQVEQNLLRWIQRELEAPHRPRALADAKACALEAPQQAVGTGTLDRASEALRRAILENGGRQIDALLALRSCTLALFDQHDLPALAHPVAQWHTTGWSREALRLALEADTIAGAARPAQGALRMLATALLEASVDRLAAHAARTLTLVARARVDALVGRLIAEGVPHDAQSARIAEAEQQLGEELLAQLRPVSADSEAPAVLSPQGSPVAQKTEVAPQERAAVSRPLAERIDRARSAFEQRLTQALRGSDKDALAARRALVDCVASARPGNLSSEEHTLLAALSLWAEEPRARARAAGRHHAVEKAYRELSDAYEAAPMSRFGCLVSSVAEVVMHEGSEAAEAAEWALRYFADECLEQAEHEGQDPARRVALLEATLECLAEPLPTCPRAEEPAPAVEASSVADRLRRAARGSPAEAEAAKRALVACLEGEIGVNEERARPLRFALGAWRRGSISLQALKGARERETAEPGSDGDFVRRAVRAVAQIVCDTSGRYAELYAREALQTLLLARLEQPSFKNATPAARLEETLAFWRRLDTLMAKELAPSPPVAGSTERAAGEPLVPTALLTRTLPAHGDPRLTAEALLACVDAVPMEITDRAALGLYDTLRAWAEKQASDEEVRRAESDELREACEHTAREAHVRKALLAVACVVLDETGVCDSFVSSALDRLAQALTETRGLAFDAAQESLALIALQTLAEHGLPEPAPHSQLPAIGERALREYRVATRSDDDAVRDAFLSDTPVERVLWALVECYDLVAGRPGAPAQEALRNAVLAHREGHAASAMRIERTSCDAARGAPPSRFEHALRSAMGWIASAAIDPERREQIACAQDAVRALCFAAAWDEEGQSFSPRAFTAMMKLLGETFDAALGKGERISAQKAADAGPATASQTSSVCAIDLVASALEATKSHGHEDVLRRRQILRALTVLARFVVGTVGELPDHGKDALCAVEAWLEHKAGLDEVRRASNRCGLTAAWNQGRNPVAWYLGRAYQALADLAIALSASDVNPVPLAQSAVRNLCLARTASAHCLGQDSTPAMLESLPTYASEMLSLGAFLAPLLTQPTDGPVLEKKLMQEKPGLAATLTADAIDAAYRSAGRQLTRAVQVPLAALLSRHLAPDDEALRGRIAAFLETDLGAVMLSALLSVGLSSLPALLPGALASDEKFARMAREMRVRAMSGAADLVADLAAEPLLQALAAQIKGLPEPRVRVDASEEAPAPAEHERGEEVPVMAAKATREN